MEASTASHFSRMLGWFRREGREAVTARTFAGDVCAPFSDELRSALTALIGMRWRDGGQNCQKGIGRSISGCVCLSLSWIFQITTRSII
jgi:hypothetical protein